MSPSKQTNPNPIAMMLGAKFTGQQQSPQQ